MNPVTRDLSAAFEELSTLAALGSDLERYGVGDPVAIACARTRAGFCLAAAAESMRDAGMLSAATIARLGFVIVAGMRSPAQLEGDAAWCQALAVACDTSEASQSRAA